MMRKLFAVVSNACAIDNPDSPQHQEVLLPGSLYCWIIRERLEEALNQICISPQCGFASHSLGNDVTDEDMANKLKLVVKVAKELWSDA